MKRRDVIQAVRIAARDAAKTSTNPLYVEALEMAVRVLESNAWAMPRAERIRGLNRKGETDVLIPGTVLVSDCCKAIVTINDQEQNECSKCQQVCTAQQTLSEHADQVKQKEQSK